MRPFVNRAKELANLNLALKYDAEETPVLVFTGNPGMGKTALRSSFEEQVLKPNNVPYAVLDYESDPNLCPIDATLRAIHQQLGKHGVRTPVFDYLYARYYELSTGVKVSPKNCPSELVSVVDILPGILDIGNVTHILNGLSQLGLQKQERLQHKEWLYRIRELEPLEILNLLPEVLAEDLEEAMLSKTAEVLKSSEVRICLFFDAYELLSEYQLDDTLHRKLLFLTPHLLRVIFTRAPLTWVRNFPKEWRGRIKHFPALGNLSRTDVKEFLMQRQVDNPSLQEQLHRLSGGYPLHLELAADICREILETTRWKPSFDDFQGTAQATNITDELINRLLKQMKEDEKELFELVFYPRWITAEMLEALSSGPQNIPRIFKKFTEISIFSLHPEIPEAYVIRKEVRDYLISQRRRERFWKQRHGRLLKFHLERWEKSQSFRHLQEALYHGFYENQAKVMQIFEDHFWKFLDVYRFGEAKSLIAAIPEDALSDETKRKIDYAHARLLHASALSQQSLISAKNIYEKLVTSETDEEARAQYLFSFSDLLRVMGEYGKAREYAQKALTLRLKLYGEEHTAIASSYNKIGVMYSEQNRFEKALEHYEKALAIWLKTYGEEDLNVANSYNNIAVVCYRNCEYARALEYYVKALAIWLKTHGAEDPKVGLSYQNIGSIYSEHGEFEKALEYTEKALAIWLKVYGNEHPKVALSYNNIGTVYRQEGEIGKALEYAQKGLDILLQAYGEEHQDISQIYDNIGMVYWRRGEYEKALEYHEKSLAVLQKNFGQEHPNVATPYSYIGISYKELGKYDRALEYGQKGLAILLQIYGEEHPALAQPYYCISTIYREQGTYGLALDYGQRGLNILLKAHGEEHWGVSFFYNNVGIIYGEQGEFEKALEYAEKGLANGLKMYGEEHFAVAESYFALSIICRKKGEFEKALEYAEKALAVQLKVYGKEHPTIAASYKEIAYIFQELKRDQEAYEKIQQSVKIYTKFSLWRDAEKALETLGGWLEKAEQKNEAKEVDTEANDIPEDFA